MKIINLSKALITIAKKSGGVFCLPTGWPVQFTAEDIAIYIQNGLDLILLKKIDSFPGEITIKDSMIPNEPDFIISGYGSIKGWQ